MTDLTPFLQLGLLLVLLAATLWLALRRPRGADDLAQRVLAVKTDVERLDRVVREDGAQARLGSDERGRLLREEIQRSLGGARTENREAAAVLQSQVVHSIQAFGEGIRAQLQIAAESQARSFEAFTATLKALSETLEKNLGQLREENAAKLEEMRKTVDEKLQGTLEKRLGESFALVSQHLQAVHTGLGEMQKLSAGIGNLERAFSNVKSRGAWGEVQLGSILEDMLAPDQFERNVKVVPEQNAIVEFCIRYPTFSADERPVLLPIDAKFPVEDYAALAAAAEAADSSALDEARKALERRFRQSAKDISGKYIHPPHTTDYAVMFVPSEGIYAEAARIPGLLANINREYRVMVAGPSNLMAILIALKASYRSAAIQRQAGDISKVLVKVQAEFQKYAQAVTQVRDRAEKTVKAIGDLETRQRQIGRAFKGIEALRGHDDAPGDAAQMIIEAMSEELPTDIEQMSAKPTPGETSNVIPLDVGEA